MGEEDEKGGESEEEKEEEECARIMFSWMMCVSGLPVSWIMCFWIV